MSEKAKHTPGTGERDTMSEAIPLDDAGRRALRVGDVVRMVYDPEYQFLVTNKPYGGPIGTMLIDLRETTRDAFSTPHRLEGVTHLITQARSPNAPQPTEADTLREKLAALVKACEPFVKAAESRPWVMNLSDASGLDEMNVGGINLTNGDLRALRAAVMEAMR